MPSPKDPANAPVWENYIVAQLTQASLGVIPRNALALGIEVHDLTVRVHVQMVELTPADQADLDEIVSELGALTGEAVQVDVVVEIRAQRHLPEGSPIRWVYLRRSEE